MRDLKIWTVDEANAALPRVRALTQEVRDAVSAQRVALAEAAALKRATPGAPDGTASTSAYADHLRHAEEAGARVRRALREFQDLGVEMKDPFEGLVDFPTLRGSTVVYLCWKRGESEVAHWHGLSTGFGGRRPVDALVRAAGK